MGLKYFYSVNPLIPKGLSQCLIVLYIISSSGTVFSQEWIGSSTDNYTPANAMLINPSAIVDQKPWLDIHLAGVGVHATNNFAYLNQSTLLNFGAYGNPAINLERKTGWAQVNTQVLGPSASLSIGKQALGIHFSVRGSASISKVPIEYADYLINEGSDEDSTVLTVNNTRIKTLAWGEIGLTYGRILYQFDRHLMSGAVTVNRLFGLQSAALFIDDGEMLIQNNVGELLDGSGKYAYTNPALRAGGGWSASLGATYKRMLDDVTSYVPHGRGVSCHTLPYKWKFSASLVDLGGIRMKRGALYNRFDSDEEADQYLNSISDGLDMSAVPKDGDKYTAWLPMGVNAQFDYNFENGLFLNGLFTQRLSFPSSYGPDRSNLIAVTPRFEKRWLMVAMPFSLENYRDPHLGLALRLWVLTIGTEHVFPYFIPSDIYTADVYISLRIRFNRAPGCREKPLKGLEDFKFGDIFRRHENDPAACPDW
ncbi:DUF5723 family protein [bacterium]|nr:DUF5723 family protein [bacterium]